MLGGARVLDQDLDLGGVRVHNPRAPLASDDLVRLQDVASVDIAAVVTTAANAPHNAIDLSTLGGGVLAQTVSGGVATLKATSITSGNVMFGAGDGTVAQSANINFNSFTSTLTARNVSVVAAFSAPFASATLPSPGTSGYVKINHPDGALSVDNTNYIPFGSALSLVSDVSSIYTVASYAGTIVFDPAGFAVTPNAGSDLTIALSATAVTPGSYTNADITVGSDGRITAASNGSGGSPGITQLTGDVTAGPGSGSQAATLASVVTAGSATYASVTVDAKGRVTAFSSGAAPLVKANNLSDVTSAATARTNLGLVAIAASGSAADITTGTLPAARLGSFTGDATSAGGSYALTLANSGVTAGSYSYPLITVDAKGRVTGASDGWSALVAAFAPANGKYIVQQANVALPNAQAMASLGTGIVKNTTTTGVLSIAVAGFDYLSPGNNLSDVASASTARTNLGLGTAAVHAATDFEVPLTFSSGVTRATNTITNDLITGKSGGQTVIGGTASGNGLTLRSNTSDDGKFVFGASTDLTYNQSNGRLSWGTASPSYRWHVADNAADVTFYLQNSTSSTVGETRFLMGSTSNGAGASRSSFSLLGASFTASGNQLAGSAIWNLVGGAGNMIITNEGSGDLILAITASDTERIRIKNGSGLQFANTKWASFSTGAGTTPSGGTAVEWAMTPAAIASAASATLDAHKWDATTVTLTGTTHVTTAAGFNFIDIERPTYTDSSAVTIDIGATVTIKGDPVPGGSVTLTTPLAFWVQQGTTRLDGYAIVGGNNGDSIGTALLLSQAHDQAITKNGGNLYLATSDSHSIAFVTNGTSRGSMDASGNLSWSAGIVTFGSIGGAGSVLRVNAETSYMTVGTLTNQIRVGLYVANSYPQYASIATDLGYYGQYLVGYYAQQFADLYVAAGGNNALHLGWNGDAGTPPSMTDVITINSTGVGFFNATPVARQTGGAFTFGSTYTTAEKSKCQAMWDALRAYNLLS